MQRFDRYMTEHGMRRSPERAAVLAEVLQSERHFSVENLYELLTLKGVRLSMATLYNTMQMLVDAHVLRKVVIGDSPECSYELDTLPPHMHLVCTHCGKMKEVRDPNLITFMRTRKYTAFTPEHYELVVYGICSTCARKRTRRK